MLIVDDDEAARVRLRRILERENWTVREAANGQQALERLRKEPRSSFCSTSSCPRWTGLRSRGSSPRPGVGRIPVVVLTAKDVDADDRASLDTSHILQKGSFTDRELLAEVRRAVESYTRPRGGTGASAGER